MPKAQNTSFWPALYLPTGGMLDLSPLSIFGALAIHGALKTRRVDIASFAAQCVLRQVEGKAKRIVELEGHLARQGFAVAEPRCRRAQ